MLTGRSMHCCGIKEILNLSSFILPEIAIMAFIRMWKKGEDHSGYAAYPGTMYTNYVFTAAVYDTEICSGPREHKSSKYDHQYLKNGKLWDAKRGMYFPYGHNFAEFIEKHKLGTVVSPGEGVNEAFHNDHKVAAWVWRPDSKALEAYAKKHNYDVWEKYGIIDTLANIGVNAVTTDKYMAKPGSAVYAKSCKKTAMLAYQSLVSRLTADKVTVDLPTIPIFDFSFEQFAKK